MGNQKSSLHIETCVQHVFDTSQIKSHWLLDCYIQERMEESQLFQSILQPAVLKLNSAWKFNRRLGAGALEKMLTHSEPVRALSDRAELRCVSCLLSLVLGAVSSHEEVASERLFSNEVHGIQLTELRTFVYLMVEDLKAENAMDAAALKQRLEGLKTKLCSVAARIGKNFKYYPSLVDIYSLSLWGQWTLLYILYNVALIDLGHTETSEVLSISSRAASELETFSRMLLFNLRSVFSLELQERTTSISEETIRIVEASPRAWMSKDYRFDAAASNKAIPSSSNNDIAVNNYYSHGLFLNDQYRSAWDCSLSDFYSCNAAAGRCVKCGFVEGLARAASARLKPVLTELADVGGLQQLLKGMRQGNRL